VFGTLLDVIRGLKYYIPGVTLKVAIPSGLPLDFDPVF
jgi:hypothetical protein